VSRSGTVYDPSAVSIGKVKLSSVVALAGLCTAK
jgi:hypothetical protein